MDLHGVPFTKVYRSMLTSSIWTTPHPQLHMIRCVWVTLMLLADRRGYVHASLPGLAAAAMVTVEEAEQALSLFASPDRYSRTKEHEGRRLVEVEGGWLLLNYESHRERASAELSKQSKRDWYHRNKKPPSDPPEPSKTRTPVLVSSSLDKIERVPSLSRSDLDLDPERARPTSADTEPSSVTWIPEEWKPGPDLYADAIAAGCTKEGLDEAVGYWRGRKLGGQWRSPEAFLRAKLPGIRDRESAARIAKRNGTRPGAPPRPGDDLDTTGAATAFRTNYEHRDFAIEHLPGVDIEELARQCRKVERFDKLSGPARDREFLARLRYLKITGAWRPDGPLRLPRDSGAVHRPGSMTPGKVDAGGGGAFGALSGAPSGSGRPRKAPSQ